MDKHRNSLKPGYRLHWYLIKKILGQGGFGITYLAEDTNLNQLVAIKEYLPIELAVREGDSSVQAVSADHSEPYSWGLDRFMSEAQTLAKFKHPNIVRVMTVFPENNTAYMVMEFEHGKGLHEILKKKNTLTEQELKNILMPILDGLEAVHASGFIHRDIKPPNIYIRDDESPVLLDFGSARQSLSIQTRTLTTMVSPGYAPFEQYVGKSDKQGPWTDIYGLGATLYRAVTGKAPAGSMDRSEALLHTEKDIFVSAAQIAQDKYSPVFLAAIDHALAFKAEDRPQTIGEWKQEFNGAVLNELDQEADTFEPTAAVVMNDGESEATTAEPQVKEDQPEKEMTSNASQPSSYNQLIDKTYGTVKSLLKWGMLVLIVLILVGVLTNGEKQEELEQAPDIQPAKIMDEPVDVSPAETDISAEPIEETATDTTTDQDQLINQLLVAAEEDLIATRLTTPAGRNAVEKYRKILQLDPDNRQAREGLDRVVNKYIYLMDNAISHNHLDSASNYLHKGITVNPNHSNIPAAQARLDAARMTELQREHEAQLAIEEQAESNVTDASKQIVPEEERNALQDLKDRLRDNPNDKQAKKELKNLASKFEENIRTSLKNKDYDLAEAYVNEVIELSPPKSKSRKNLIDLLRKIRKQRAEALQ